MLENLHGAEISIEALQYVVRRLGPTPTLIVGSYRQTETDKRHPLIRMLDSFADDPRFASMTLGPFSPSEHRALVESAAGGSKISDALAERLRDATEGNPFFTKELVRSLIDSGGIAKDDSGSWNFSKATAISSDALPATIQRPSRNGSSGSRRACASSCPSLRSWARASTSGTSRPWPKTRRTWTIRPSSSCGKDCWKRRGNRAATGCRLRAGSCGTFSTARSPAASAGPSTASTRSCWRNATRDGSTASYPDLVHHFSQADIAEKTVEYGLKLSQKSLDAFGADDALRAAKTCLEFLEDEEWAGDPALEGEARLLAARAQPHGRQRRGRATRGRVGGQGLRQGEAPREGGGGHSFRRGDRLAGAPRGRNPAVGRTRHRGLRVGRENRREGQAPLARRDRRQPARRVREGGRVSGRDRAAGPLGEGRRGRDPARRPARRRHGEPDPDYGPGAYQTTEEHEVLGNVFETLVTTDTQGNLVPFLCERWAFEEGGRTVRLELRSGITFSDGTPLTAAVVKASLERSIRVSREATPAAFVSIEGVSEHLEGKAPGVSGIRAPSEHRVEIRLTDALPIFPAFLTDGRTSIALATGEGSALAGTGPFRIVDQTPERVVLERSPGYWRDTPARLDQIEFRAGLSAAAIASGLKSGELELARDLLPKDLETILREPRFRSGLVETPKKNSYFALFNASSAGRRQRRAPPGDGPRRADAGLRVGLSRPLRLAGDGSAAARRARPRRGTAADPSGEGKSGRGDPLLRPSSSRSGSRPRSIRFCSTSTRP